MVTCHLDQMRSYTTRYPAKLLKSQRRGLKKTRKVSLCFPSYRHTCVHVLYVELNFFKFCYFPLFWCAVIYLLCTACETKGNYTKLSCNRQITCNYSISKLRQLFLASLDIFTELKTRKSLVIFWSKTKFSKNMVR